LLKATLIWVRIKQATFRRSRLNIAKDMAKLLSRNTNSIANSMTLRSDRTRQAVVWRLSVTGSHVMAWQKGIDRFQHLHMCSCKHLALLDLSQKRVQDRAISDDRSTESDGVASVG